MIRVELPDSVARRFAEAGAEGSCAFATCGDLTLAGAPGRRWLGLFGKTLFLADDDGPVKALAFEDVQGFRALGGAGNGCLQARTERTGVDSQILANRQGTKTRFRVLPWPLKHILCLR